MYKKSDWKTKASLAPGQRGTKKVFAQYGEDLFCVRYRYHKDLRRRIKTVELVIEEIELDEAETLRYYLIQFRGPTKRKSASFLIETPLSAEKVIARMFGHPLLKKYTPLDWLGLTRCEDLAQVDKKVKRISL